MRTLINDLLQKVGEDVELSGWVDTKRDHGKLTFIDLRDRTGKVQCVGFGKMGDLTVESVVKIKGKVNLRPERMINKDIPTGTIEVEVADYEILSKATELPIQIDGSGLEIGEEVRLKYRYIDLRRERLNRNLKIRSSYIQSLRNSLLSEDFTEIETPLLSKATMEGARDFVVPSRFQPGKFYALPQSPQQYKQLLMVAGFEKYFQFPRCLRDEDLRADRGFEHTQLDLEMSFVEKADVMELIERIVKKAVVDNSGVLKDDKFPVFTYDEAIEKYGADKFDLRTEEDKKNGVLAFAWVVNFPFFKKVDRKDVAEIRDGKSGWTFTHNPFSAPNPEHEQWLLKGENIDKIQTNQYDLVCNGLEVGGGSIRTHKKEVLEATYKVMGYSDEQIKQSIGHILDAFSFGTPPHGGIALGIDRQIANLVGEDSIKEVMAFPMSSTGRTAVMDAPAAISQELLDELGIKIK